MITDPHPFKAANLDEATRKQLKDLEQDKLLGSFAKTIGFNTEAISKILQRLQTLEINHDVNADYIEKLQSEVKALKTKPEATSEKPKTLLERLLGK